MRRPKQDEREPSESQVRCARLEPIRVVRRQLKRPDGTTLEVDVPVYPPFRLESRPAPTAPPARHSRRTGDECEASEESESGRS